MSLEDEDDLMSSSTECVDLNNNNNHNMTDEAIFSTIDKQDDDNNSFFRELFNVYDIHQNGYILVNDFIEITKKNMVENSFLDDENKLKEFVKIIDPKGTDRIVFYDFVQGMTSLMADNSNKNTKNSDNHIEIEGQDLITRSRSSTSMEGEIPVLQITKNLTEEIFENYEPNTPNSSNKTSSNEYEYENNDTAESLDNETETDFFGIDSSVLKNHRKSLSVRKSISMSGMVLNSKRLSMHNLQNKDDSDYDNDGTPSPTHDGKYEHFIEDLEFKIKGLEQQNETLKSEINEQINKNKYQNSENSHLILKIREFEDHNNELEHKFLIQIKDENFRHQENLNRILFIQQEEKENFLNQIRNLEGESADQTLEIANNLKKIDEMSKLCDEKETQNIYESSRVNELQFEYKKSLIEIENLTSEQDKLKFNCDEKIEQLKKEIFESKILLENSQQEYYHERKNTLYDESYYLNQISQLETDNRLFKIEIDNLNASLDELSANIKIYKSNKDESMAMNQHDNFIPRMPNSNTQDSFLSEVFSSKEDDLLEKLIEERKNTQRLREYVEELTSKILEHNPSLLENGPTVNKSLSNSKNVSLSASDTKSTTSDTKSRNNSISQKTEKAFNYKRLLKLVN